MSEPIWAPPELPDPLRPPAPPPPGPYPQYSGNPSAPYDPAAPLQPLQPAQPYAYAYGYPGYAPPRPSGTDGFAIAALVLSLLGGLLLSVIFGCIALSRTKRTGQAGRGLAIAALWVSGAWAVVIAGLAVLVVLINPGPTTSLSVDAGDGGGPGVRATATVTQDGVTATATATAGGADAGASGGAGDQSSFADGLVAGDCVNGLSVGADEASVHTLPCTKPHQGEVVGLVTVTGNWPGESAMRAQSEARCDRQARAYSPSHADDPALSTFWFRPSHTSWSVGDRTVVCFVIAAVKRTGSIAG